MVATEEIHDSVCVPPPFGSPETLSGLGLKTSLITDLFLKHALVAGNNTLSDISETLKIAVPLSESLFHLLKTQQLIDVMGMQRFLPVNGQKRLTCHKIGYDLQSRTAAPIRFQKPSYSLLPGHHPRFRFSGEEARR
jgi:hypothetical protein